MSITLNQLVDTLKIQNVQKRDMVVNSSNIKFVGGRLVISGSGQTQLSELLSSSGVNSDQTISYSTTEPFDRQMAAKLEIPMPYFGRMRNALGKTNLLDTNVNEWLRLTNQNFLIRTLVDESSDTYIARAFLGDRYRMLDNIDILFSALEAVRKSGVNIKIESADLTDTKMYVRFIAPDVVIQSPELLKSYRVPGTPNSTTEHGIMAGFVLSNSETGHGSSFIAPRMVVNACKNGMIFKEDSSRHVHLGGKLAESQAIEWSESTRRKNIELIMSQITDAVQTYLNPEYLGNAIGKLLDDGTKPIANPTNTIVNVANELQFSQNEQDKLLEYFMTGGDFTGFGVAQAITFFAHDASKDADQRFELEQAATEFVTAAYQFDEQPKARRRKSNKSFSEN